MRSPGFTRTIAPTATARASVSVHAPSGCLTLALSGASRIRPWIARRARSSDFFPIRGQPAREHGDGSERGAHPGRLSEPRDGLGRNRRHPGERKRPPRLVGLRGGCCARLAAFGEFRREAERADCLEDRAERMRRMHDCQHALHQVELQAGDCGHRAELLADQRFLGRAVHLQDADRRADAVGRDRRRGERRERRGGGRTAGVGMVV
jgi:hypothetical protein